MLRGHRPIALAVLALGLTAPAAARATPQDVAATHAYIVANAALARASEARVRSTQVRIVQLQAPARPGMPQRGRGLAAERRRTQAQL